MTGSCPSGLNLTEHPSWGADPFRRGAAGPALPLLWGTPHWRSGPPNREDVQASPAEVISLKGDTWGARGGQGIPEGKIV